MAYGTINQGLLDKAPTIQRLRKIEIGTIIRNLVEQYVAGTYGGCHIQADATNTFTTAVPTDQSTLNAFLNTFKTKLNAHYQMAGPVHTWASYNHKLAFGAPHMRADSTNTVSTAAATDEASAITLANAIKAKLILHALLDEPVHKLSANAYTSRRGGAHLQSDSVDAVATADATNYATAYTLLNDLKAALNLHYIKSAPHHRHADNAYAAGRGAPHLVADSNAEATANATDAATGYALANSLKAKHNAHCGKLLGIHHVADATNTTAAADADDEAKTVTLANELKADLNAHAADTTHGHFIADGINSAITTADATNFATSWTLLNVCKAFYNAHIAAAQIAAKETAIITSANATDAASAHTLANELKTDLNAHMASAVLHYQADTQTAAVAAAAASDEATTVALANALKVAHNLHVVSYVMPARESDIESTADATDTATLYALLNALKVTYNAHIIDRVPHYQADALNSAVTTADATTEGTAVALANALKAAFNLHIATEIVKAPSDALISSADASDAATSQTLVNEIKTDLNTHRTDLNLHNQTDTQDAIATASATSLATALALAIACQTFYTAHIASEQAIASTAEDLSDKL